MMVDTETLQASWIAYLKSQPSLVALLDSSLEIKEYEYQADHFKYPGVRVSVDHFPSVISCNPDNIDVFIDVFSEEKSSKQAAHIAAVLTSILQKHVFTQNGIKYSMVWVKEVKRPVRDIYAWKSCLLIKGLAN
jgi:hypothetical protein